jgi:hypothetical protein
MFSASPISLTDVSAPSSSMRCHRQARASALEACRPAAASRSARARCRPAPRSAYAPRGAGNASGSARRAWCRRALSRRSESCRHAFALLPQLAHEARQSLGPDPHLKRVLLHVDPLNEELDDPRLLGRERVISERIPPTARVQLAWHRCPAGAFYKAALCITDPEEADARLGRCTNLHLLDSVRCSSAAVQSDGGRGPSGPRGRGRCRCAFGCHRRRNRLIHDLF